MESSPNDLAQSHEANKPTGQQANKQASRRAGENFLGFREPLSQVAPLSCLSW